MLLALWKVIDTWYDFRIEVGSFPLPGGGGEAGVPSPPASTLSSSFPWAGSGSAHHALYWFVLRIFQNFYFYWLSLIFVGFVFCHFDWFSQHPGHLGKYQASQNNWWKVTLPLQPRCWFGSSLPMRCSSGETGSWGSWLIATCCSKGWFFYIPYTTHCLFSFYMLVSGSLVSGSAHGWVSLPWHKTGGRGLVLGAEGEWDLPISSGQLWAWLICHREPYW